MKLKNNFNAVLLGESLEMRVRKSDGSLYPFTQVAIMQDNQVCNLRMKSEILEEVKKLEQFKNYKFYAEFNTDYSAFEVVDVVAPSLPHLK